MYKSVCVSRQKPLMLHSSVPTPIPPPQEVWCSGTNLLQYLQVNIYLLEKSEFRMEKVSEKQGSSAVESAFLWWMAAFFRHCPEQLQLHTDSTALSHFLSVHCRRRAQHHEQSQSQFDAHRAGNSTDWTAQHSTGPIICKGLSSENSSKVRLLPTEHCSWNYQARSQMRWRQLVLWVWWISWWHKHHKQEKLPTSFTDRFGIDQKTSKKEVIAPLPSPRRKLCLENEDDNAENIYLVFPEEALGTHKHIDFHALVPWCNRCWWNALLLSLFEPAAHQNHYRPYKTKHLVTNQCPHSSASSTKQSRRGHLIFSLPLLISI